MSEKNILIEDIALVSLYGKNNENIDLLQQFYPDIKIIARGNEIKIQGSEELIQSFEKKLLNVIYFLKKRPYLNSSEIKYILEHDILPEGKIQDHVPEDIILYGNNGIVIKAQNTSQKNLVSSIEQNDMVFAIGPAGTGKTYTAVALAVKALKNKEVRKIILTRPAVEAGENLGFLPGDLKEKLDPYLQPLYDALHDMIHTEKLKYFLENQIIQIAPLAFMRGRTLDHAFVILDEAQNATQSQLKMFLTRMGRSAKFVITGDLTQVDLPKNQPSGLIQAKNILSDVEGIDFVYLQEKDIIRHRLVKEIIKAYENL